MKKIRNNPYFWIWILTSFLWGILNIRYILGEYACFYTDIGGDTFHINYPLYSLFSEVFQGKGFDSYFLNVGLGMDMSSYVYQYINPVNLLVVLLPESMLPWSVLLASYIKLVIIGIFGYKLFFQWIGNVWGSLVASLVWTFSSYVMLWGQHFGFCTSIMMFTVFLYLVHLYTADRKKQYKGILVIWITFLLFTNYYFLYMSGIIGAFYICIFGIFEKKSWKKIIGKLAGLLGMGVLGISIGGVCLIPTIQVFYNSTRVNAVGVGNIEILRPYNFKWILTFIARLFSNNTMGVGNQYTGQVNYYETAMLFTSSLLFLALPYLLLNRKTRKKTAFLTCFSVLLLIFPVTGKILTMNVSNQRWSFILCLMEALVCGIYVKMILEELNRKKVWISLITGIAVTGAAYFLLLMGKKAYGYKIRGIYILIFVTFLSGYGVLTLLKNKNLHVKKVFPVLLTGMICAEMLVANYPTINFRENPTRHQVASEYYNDGSEKIYEKLASEDPSLFRLAKSYVSASYNDSMCQGYPGLSVYLSTNAKELIDLKERYGGKGYGNNSVAFDETNFLMQALLGMKYFLTIPGCSVSPTLYDYMGAEANKEIYRFSQALPFGYFYDREWNIEEIAAMSEVERTYAALHGFYFTDKTSQTEYKSAKMNRLESHSLLGWDMIPVNCTAVKKESGIAITDMQEDPNLIMEDVGELLSQGISYVFTVKAKVTEKVEMELYYKNDAEGEFNPYQVYTFTISPKEDTWQCVLPAGITDLRLDVSTETDQVMIEQLSVGKNKIADEAYEQLRDSCVKDTCFKNNTYYATVCNLKTDIEMLCVPLLYSEGFHAYVDGNATNMYNINSGLCGIEIPPGEHEVKLLYEAPYKKSGVMLSVAGLAVYGILLLYFQRQRNKKTKGQ